MRNNWTVIQRPVSVTTNFCLTPVLFGLQIVNGRLVEDKWMLPCGQVLLTDEFIKEYKLRKW